MCGSPFPLPDCWGTAAPLAPRPRRVVDSSLRTPRRVGLPEGGLKSGERRAGPDHLSERAWRPGLATRVPPHCAETGVVGAVGTSESLAASFHPSGASRGLNSRRLNGRDMRREVVGRCSVRITKPFYIISQRTFPSQCLLSGGIVMC